MPGKPGSGGPVPKRSDQRHGHRSKNEKESVTKAEAGSQVKVPPASKDWHPIARDWYRSLKNSGQARYYEASDWQTARFVAEAMSRNLKAEKFSAQLFSGVMSAMTELLTTEGARRRAKLELQRGKEDGAEEANDVSWIDDARARLRAAD